MRTLRLNEHIAARPFPWVPAAEEKAAALFNWLAFRPYAAVVALTLLCCVLYLPGIATLPVTDRDEARFAQASKQMLETGDYIDIRFQNEPRYKKPIGIYWLQTAAVTIATKAGAALDEIWAYRIPSFLGALGAVLLTFWTARAVVGREGALAAAALFATCLTLSFESRIAKSDAALIVSIVLMQGALFRLYLSPNGSDTRGLAALFWLGLGAGILIKGPVSPGLAILTCIPVLIRDRERAWIKNFHWKWGLPLLLAITLPWFIAIGISSNGEFFRSSLGQDFAAKLQGGQEKHWGPPGFYFVSFWWMFWPAVLFATAGAVRALWQGRHSRRVLFLLAWIIPFWLVIEAIPTKLPHYALPLYPAIAIAAVLAMQGYEKAGARRSRFSAILWATLAALQIVVLIATSWIAEAPHAILLGAILAIFAAVAAFTAMAAWRSHWHAALLGVILSGAAFYAATFRIALPGLEPLWISSKAAAAAGELRLCAGKTAGFAGFAPPSLVFLNGTKTVMTAPVPLAEMLAAGTTDIAFVNWNRRQDFERAYLQNAGNEPHFAGCVDGIDINGRGPTRLQIYTRQQIGGNTGCEAIPAVQCHDKGAVRWRRLFDTKF